MQEIIKAKQESRAQSILKLLRYRGPLAVGDLSLDFKVSPKLVDRILYGLGKERRVKTEDGVFWEIGPEPRVIDGCDVKPIAPYLVVLCGPSHSGKSTFARKSCKGFRVISSDRIRKRLKKRFHSDKREPEVWKAFDKQKRRAVRDGYDIVVDACHMSEKARRHSVEGVNRRYKRICIVFGLPLNTIRERCLKARRMPMKEAERMWRAFRHNQPTVQELKQLGFDEVYFIKQ